MAEFEVIGDVVIKMKMSMELWGLICEDLSTEKLEELVQLKRSYYSDWAQAEIDRRNKE